MPPPSGQASAEIKITLEMCLVGDRIFDDWLDENADSVRENGGSGDSHSLFAALWADWKKLR